MNKNQAKRIAMAVKGIELTLGNSPACINDALNASDREKVAEAIQVLGWDLLQRAGFDEIPRPELILNTVLGLTVKAA